MHYFIGIDFGTATSCIAYTTEKSAMSPELVEIDGKKTINTAIRLTPDGKEVESFGDEAWEGYQEEPHRTFVEFKMDVGLGKKYEREGFSITPEEVGILFLRSLREKLERQFGRTSLSELDAKNGVTTVIGYPAEWSRAQKTAVEDMAKQAGFPNVEGGVEPVGVIYYHALNGEIPLDAEQKVFVYDFGGGTSDTAIVAMSASTPPHVYDFDGLTDLGGRDYDEAIVEHVFKPLFKCEQYSSADLAEFQRKAQVLKERLSGKILDGFDRAEVHLAGLNCLSGASRTVSLTRQEFEEIEKSLVERFLAPVKSSLQQTGFSVSEIKFVIASGGSARLYFVDTLLQKMFPHSSYLRSNTPQEVIAKGLALFASRAGKNLRKATRQAEDEVIIDVEADAAGTTVSNDKRNVLSGMTETVKKNLSKAYNGSLKSFPEKRKTMKKSTKIIGAIVLCLCGFMLFSGGNSDPDPTIRISESPSSPPVPTEGTIKDWSYGLAVTAEKSFWGDDVWTIEQGEIVRSDILDIRDMGNGLYCVDVNISARHQEYGVDVQITFEYGELQNESLLLNRRWYNQTTVQKIGNW